ncbi:PucR family transcriptional regulator [Actinomadura monticuli]|uniref:Helix-turn-helix domain-containing protein n=1 Tax=Actinomadura monticuli TaxID=3097367 RepID=A0ABV4Q5Z4_9ACTN
MTSTLVGGGSRPRALPAQVIAILGAELPSLAEEIVEEIRRSVPEYARREGRSERAAYRITVEQTMAAFLDQFTGGGESYARRDELCRELGRSEAYQGRTLDALQAAYRVGVQVAWRRVASVARERRLPAEVMTRLAEALFAYIDELASLSVEGYLEVRSSADELPGDRRRLLRMVLGPGAATGALTEAAEAAGWDVPATVTMVAMPAGARCLREAMDGDVLVNLADAEPHLLIPGPYSPERAAMLNRALPERRSAVGLTVPLAQAADSLRWARRALALVESGCLEDAGPTLCERHLLELWLLSDGPLLDQLARRELAALAGMPRTRRMRMTETLVAWLDAQGNAVEAANRLRLHPQTVRYRMRQISVAFDRQLADPAARFVLDAVLRAHRLRERRPSLK